MGGSIEEAADILGDSEAILRKHYVKWTAAHQARITDLLARIWHAKRSQPETNEDESENLVDLERFKPSTSSMPWKRNAPVRDRSNVKTMG